MGEEVPVPVFSPSSSQDIRQFYASKTGKYNFGDYPNTNGVYLQGMGGTSSGIYVNGTFVMGNNYVNFGVSAGNGGYGFGVSSGGSIIVKNRGGDWTVITDINNPAGSNKQVQFNNNGSFGACTGFTFDNSNNQVNITDGTLTIDKGGEETINIKSSDSNNNNEASINLKTQSGSDDNIRIVSSETSSSGPVIELSDETTGTLIKTVEIMGTTDNDAGGYHGGKITLTKLDSSAGPISTDVFEIDGANQRILMRDWNNGFSVKFGVSTSITQNSNFFLPNGNGTDGYVLETDGSGNTNWTAPTNSFSTVSVDGVTNIVSTSSTDTLILEAGTNMSITADIPNKKVTFTSSGGGGGGGGTPSGEDNSIQYKDGLNFAGDASFKFFTQHPTTTGGLSTVTIDGNLFSGMSVIDKQSETPGTYQITAAEFVNGFVFPPCQSPDENQLFVVQVPTYTQIRNNFSTSVLKEGQTFDTVIYGTSIGSSPAIGISFPSDITVLESSDNSTIFDRRLVSDKTISGGLSFHFADATLPYYQGVVIRSRMGSAGVSMYPYATSFYTC